MRIARTVRRSEPHGAQEPDERPRRIAGVSLAEPRHQYPEEHRHHNVPTAEDGPWPIWHLPRRHDRTDGRDFSQGIAWALPGRGIVSAMNQGPATLGTLPERAARRWGGREAVYFRGRRTTFADLAAGVDRVAREADRARRPRRATRSRCWLLNRPEWIEIAFAVMKIGAVLVPINTRLRTEDVAYIVDQSDIVDADPGRALGADRLSRHGARAGARNAAPGAAGCPSCQHLVVLGDAPRPATTSVGRAAPSGPGRSSDATLARCAADAWIPDALAFLMYTSGTTGFPKARCTPTR